jgi:hypothetical protein
MSIEHTGGGLAAGLIQLAETPDDAPDIEPLLRQITQFAVDRIVAVSYASITGLRGEGYTMVAASSDLIRAVDEAQFDQGGPCVQALQDQAPVDATDRKAMIDWPRFAAEADRLGLTAALSVPLYTGSGAAAAVLNLYGRDDIALAPLVAGIWRIYDPERPLSYLLQPPPPEPGAQDLLTGFGGAVAVRAVIQEALSRIIDDHDCTAGEAYQRLCADAARTGTTLRTAAEAINGRAA